MIPYILIEYTQTNEEYLQWIDNIICKDFFDKRRIFFPSYTVLTWLNDNCEDWAVSDGLGADWITFEFPDDATFLAFRTEWSLIQEVFVYKVLRRMGGD